MQVADLVLTPLAQWQHFAVVVGLAMSWGERREDDNACLSVSVAVFVLPSFKYGWQMLGFRYHFLLYFLYRKIIFYFLLVVVGGGQATKYLSLRQKNKAAGRWTKWTQATVVGGGVGG